MTLLAFPHKLRSAGVIGINERNISLVSRFNSRKAIKFANDKLMTKRMCAEAQIPAPELYGVVETCRRVKCTPRMIDCIRGAVVKPAQGAQGNGVLILTHRDDEGFRKGSGKLVSETDLSWHVNNILSGMYSLGGQADVAMVEERVQFDTCFDHVSYKGVPDIRIIALKGVPIAAMLRLPTRQSDGKANLHKGGVGVGICIADGRATGAMHDGHRITEHPDTGASLIGLDVPYWEEMLQMAAKCYDISGLGYLGADIVLDRDKGPMLLELNARPGIAIQIANGEGLKRRIADVTQLDTSEMAVDHRVEYARLISASRIPLAA